MNRFDSYPPVSETPASGLEPFPLPDTDRTLQIPRLPSSDNPPLQITPGGARRDWRLVCHFVSGVAVLLAAVGFMLCAPTPPPNVVAAPQTKAEPQPQPFAPAAAPAPPPASPSYYVPQQPMMFQAPQNAAPHPVRPLPVVVPVEPALARRTDFDAARPFVYGRAGFAVPPAAPLPAASGVFPQQR
jgi:hypothetical protein